MAISKASNSSINQGNPKYKTLSAGSSSSGAASTQTVDVLLVGGGGAGGINNAGGGGAGGILYAESKFLIKGRPYQMVVGTGGVKFEGTNTNNWGGRGEPTTFAAIVTS